MASLVANGSLTLAPKRAASGLTGRGARRAPISRRGGGVAYASKKGGVGLGNEEIEVPEAVANATDKVKSAWEQTEDKPAVVTLIVYGVIGLWVAVGVLKAVDTLPLFSGLFELIGIGFTFWFVYRYLLFKPDREELVKNVKSLYQKVL